MRFQWFVSACCAGLLGWLSSVGLDGCRFDPLAKVGQEPTCGNGVREGRESCDGADLGGKTCQSIGLGAGDLFCRPDCSLNTTGCSVQPVCGNDRAEGEEECDGSDLKNKTCIQFGYLSGSLSCRPDCTLDESGCQAASECGNGIVDNGESCDDGNSQDGDGCGKNCQGEPGWSCHGQPSVCNPRCGDGIVVSGFEDCDDGNSQDGDGCSSDCVVERGYGCDGHPSTCRCRILVDQESTAEDPDGLTWDKAFSNLHAGLAAARQPPSPLVGPCEVWVAAGSYEPYVDSDQESFDLPSGVALYGGFEGSETARTDRDVDGNLTRLATSLSPSVVTALSVSDVVLDGFVIEGGRGGAAGGGLYVVDSGIRIRNCLFQSNRADIGGAVALAGESVVDMADCTFQTNSAVDGDAGALLLRQSAILDLHGCDFIGNDCSVDGGAISAWDDADLTVSGCQFRNNRATHGSGALWFGGRNLDVVGSVFDSNHSSATAGALGLWGGGDQTIVDSDFGGNRGLYGGAVFVTEGRSGRIEDSRFTANVGLYGGAIEVWGAELRVIGCLFDSNRAEGDNSSNGGAIGVYDSSDAGGMAAALVVSRAQFLHNTAVLSAGAVSFRWLGTGSCSGRIDNSLFWDNHVTGTGNGAAIVVSGEDAELEFVNGTVVGNDAGAGQTGGIQAISSTVRVFNSILWDNVGRDLAQWQASLTVSHSDAPNNSSGGPWSGTGNISQAPSFVASSRGDFHLRADSPCVDRAPDLGDASDLAASPRNVDQPVSNAPGLTVDMGCLERQ